MAQSPTFPNLAGSNSSDVEEGQAVRTDLAIYEQASVDNLTAAEDLLDWLESHGVLNRKLVALDNSNYLVSWQSV